MSDLKIWHNDEVYRLLDLTKYASHVYVLVRRDELRASAIMAKRLKSNPKVVSALRYVIRLLNSLKMPSLQPSPLLSQTDDNMEHSSNRSSG